MVSIKLPVSPASLVHAIMVQLALISPFHHSMLNAIVPFHLLQAGVHKFKHQDNYANGMAAIALPLLHQEVISAVLMHKILTHLKCVLQF